MRILFVNHTFPPCSWAGSEACVYHLARRMRALGHDARVFHRYGDPSDEEYRLIDEEFDGVPVARINHTHRYSNRFERVYLNRAISAVFGHWLAGFRPDLVHFHHLTNLSMDLVCETSSRGIPTVMTLHDYWLLCQRGQLLTRSLACCDGPTDEGCRNCLAPQLLKGPLLAMAARLIRRERSLAHSSPSYRDLCRLSDAQVETQDSQFVTETLFDIGGVSLPTLQAHPPTCIRRSMTLPENASLSFSIAMHPSTYDAVGDGVQFSTEVDGHQVFRRYLDPKHKPEDRGWHEVEIDLSQWSGRDVEICFRTASGPSGQIEFCTAGWGGVRLYSDPPGEESQARPSALRRVGIEAAHRGAALLAQLSPRAWAGIRHRRRWTRIVFDSVDLFISPSRFLRDFFIQHGLEEDKIIYLDNGFIPPEPLPDRRGRVSHPVRFLYIGTWIPPKGVDLLLKAFREIDPSKGMLSVYGFFPGYAGYEDYERYLYTLTKGARAIEFKGRYDPRRVYEVLAGADMMVVPSIWWENSPLTIHEAYLAGVPVIAGDRGGMAELVRDGVSGLLFRHRDRRSLRKVIERVIHEPDIIPRLREGIPPVFTMDEHVRTLLEIYENRAGRPAVEQKVLPHRKES